MTYVNPKSVIAIGVLFPVLGAVAVALRFAVRLRRKNGLGIDDWLCLPALVIMSSDSNTPVAADINLLDSVMCMWRSADCWLCDPFFWMALTFLSKSNCFSE